jgi:hypothetical protein
MIVELLDTLTAWRTEMELRVPAIMSTDGHDEMHGQEQGQALCEENAPEIKRCRSVLGGPNEFVCALRNIN